MSFQLLNTIEAFKEQIQLNVDFNKEQMIADAEALDKSERELNELQFLDFKRRVTITQTLRDNAMSKLIDLKNQFEQKIQDYFDSLRMKTTHAKNKRRLTSLSLFKKDLVTNPTHWELDSKDALAFSEFLNAKNPVAYAHVLNKCFPYLDEYLQNKESYPAFIDFAEEVPWPTSEEMDLAIKKFLGVGTKEYAENNLKLLKNYAEQNMNPTAKSDRFLVLPPMTKTTDAKQISYASDQGLPEPYYGFPKKAQNFNPMLWYKYKYFQPAAPNISSPKSISDQDIIDIQKYVIQKYKSRLASQGKSLTQIKASLESLRLGDSSLFNLPAQGEIYNRLSIDSSGRRIRDFATFSSYVEEETRSPHQIPRRLWPTEALPDVSNDTAKYWYDLRPRKNYVYIPGFDYINPSEWTEAYIGYSKTMYQAEIERRAWAKRNEGIARLYNDFVNFVKFASEFDKWVGGIMIVAFSGLTAGVGAGILGATGGAIQGAIVGGTVSTAASFTDLGKSDLGRFIISVAQALSVASITGAAFKKVIEDLLVTETKNLAIKEVGEATGLDNSVLGRMVLDVAGNTAVQMYRNNSFVNSFLDSTDKSWRLEASRENPYAAMLIGAATEIEKNGMPSVNSLNPLDWFNAFSWDRIQMPNIAEVWRSTKGTDVARLIGLGIMVDRGMITRDQAGLMIGQQIAVRNIDRFYTDQKIPVNMTEEEKQFEEMNTYVNRWKKGVSTVTNLSRGVPPTKDDIRIMTDDVASPIYDAVVRLGLPPDVELNFWDVAINDVGLPNAVQYVPDVNVSVPDWMKTEKDPNFEPVLSREQVQKDIDRELSVKGRISKEFILSLIMQLFPNSVPLIPISRNGRLPDFNFIDAAGNLTIRKPLNFAYDHPMLKVGFIKKKLTPAQEQYMLEREGEIQRVKERLEVLKQAEEQITQVGMA